jgi:uncharacterized protein YnzC (UPF0291/DUF896 family)
MLDEIARKFFDASSECPNEIPDCENHRKRYIEELNYLIKNSNCTPCSERKLRNDYINKFKGYVK